MESECSQLNDFVEELKHRGISQITIDCAQMARLEGLYGLELEQHQSLKEISPASLEKWRDLDLILKLARLQNVLSDAGEKSQ